jgi:hypothetical protein
MLKNKKKDISIIKLLSFILSIIYENINDKK